MAHELIIENGAIIEGAQFLAGSAPTSGSGVEVRYNTGVGGVIVTYDRDLSAWKELRLSALDYHFEVGGTEEITIDSAGRVGIGTTSPANQLDIESDGSYSTFGMTSYRAGITPHNSISFKSARGSESTPLIITSGDEIFNLNGYGYDGTQFIQSTFIKSFTEGTIGTDRVGGVLSFYTHPDSTGVIAERMRIDSAGNVGIGNASLKGWDSSKTSLQIGGNASLIADASVGAGRNTSYMQNVYYDGAWKYISTDEASSYTQVNGIHRFQVAVSDDADEEIIWTTALVINNSGQTQFADGAAATPSITFTSDPDTGFYSDGADIIGITAGGTRRGRFTSQGILMGSGNASAPSHGFLADIDTGMFRPGDNTIAWSTNATERMRIDSIGRVGIGGTPNTTLLIKASSATDTTFRMEPYTSGNNLTYSLPATGNRLTMAIGAEPIFDMYHSASGQGACVVNEDGLDTDFRVESDTKTHALFVQGSDGNVGIGNSSLKAWHSTYSVLQIGSNGCFYGTTAQGDGGIVALTSNAYIDNVSGGNWRYIYEDEAANYYHINGTHVFRVAESDVADAAISWTTALVINNSGQTLLADGSAAAPSLSFASDPDTGFYWDDNNVIGISSLATERMTIGTARLNLVDDYRIDLGTDHDMRIHHDGTHNYIDTIDDAEIRLYNYTDSQYMIRALPSGQVYLYFAGSRKLATSNTGIGVEGNIDVEGNIIGASANTDIVSDTSDASDTKGVRICGGGVVGTSRGGYVACYGNEHGSYPGEIFLNAGNVAGGDINFGTAGNNVGKFSYAGDLEIANNIVGTNASALSIHMDTSDASDSKVVYINGGGGTGTDRGAQISLHGNEHGNTGILALHAGNVSGGDITFNTSGSEAVRIDESGNVGIGTGATVSSSLHIQRTTGAGFLISNSGNDHASIVLDGDRTTLNDTLGAISFAWNGFQRAAIRGIAGPDTTNKDDAGIRFDVASGGTSTEAMRINYDGNVGIGTSAPSNYNDGWSNLTIYDAANGGISIITGTGNTGAIWFGDGTGAASTRGYIVYQHTADHMAFATAGNERMRINSAGNVGIGNDSLEAWASGTSALQIGGNATISAGTAQTASQGMYISQNVYYDGDFKYIVEDEASIYSQSGGNHDFYVAASDAADEVLSVITAMTINNSGQILLTNGADSAPSMSFINDTDTGMWLAGGDTLAWSTNGTERMRINSAGNVGIGTTTPGSYNSYGDNLVIYEDGNAGLTIASGTTNYSSIHFADGTAGVTAYQGQITFNHVGNVMQFAVDGSARMSIIPNGNVGIGIVDPDASLHIYNGASGQTSAAVTGIIIEDNESTGINIWTPSTHGGYIAFGDESDNNVGRIRYDHTQNSMDFFTNDTERLSIASDGLITSSPTYANDMNGDTVRSLFINSSGEIGYDSGDTGGYEAGDTIRAGDGSVGAPSYSFTSDIDTGLYYISVAKIGFSTAGTIRMDFSDDGLHLASGAIINEFSTDTALSGNSNTAVPTEQAVKTYVDTNCYMAGDTIRATNGSSSAPGLSFNSDTDTGLWRDSTYMYVTHSDIEHMSFNSTSTRIHIDDQTATLGNYLDLVGNSCTWRFDGNFSQMSFYPVSASHTTILSIGGNSSLAQSATSKSETTKLVGEIAGISAAESTSSLGYCSITAYGISSNFGTGFGGINFNVKGTGGSATLSLEPYSSSHQWIPDDHKAARIGQSTQAYDDMYSDDFNNVADFFHLDDRDDLAALHSIKGSGVIDDLTGFEVIDDSTLPTWLVSKHKKDSPARYRKPIDTDGNEIKDAKPILIASEEKRGEVMLDPDGKNYLSIKTLLSLLMGSCRQLDNNQKDAIEELNSKLQNIIDRLDILEAT